MRYVMLLLLSSVCLASPPSEDDVRRARTWARDYLERGASPVQAFEGVFAQCMSLRAI